MDINPIKPNKNANQTYYKYSSLANPPNPYHVDEKTILRPKKRSDSGIESASFNNNVNSKHTDLKSEKSSDLLVGKSNDSLTEKSINKIYERKFNKIPKELLKENFVKKENGESILDGHMLRVYGPKSIFSKLTTQSAKICPACGQEIPYTKNITSKASILPTQPKANDEKVEELVRRLEEITKKAAQDELLRETAQTSHTSRSGKMLKYSRT